MQHFTQPPQVSRLRIIMCQRRISARSLAEGTGLSASLIEKLSADARRPSSGSIQKIEQFFGLPVWSTRAQFRKASEAKILAAPSEHDRKRTPVPVADFCRRATAAEKRVNVPAIETSK
jgi:transcriptional regulator with XRE-family HTH domain